MMTTLAALDWRSYILGGDNGYFITRNIPLSATTLGQYRIEMSVSASGWADDVTVVGNYRIFDVTGQQIADQRGIVIHYSDDLVKSAERWIDRHIAATAGDPNYTRWVAEGSPIFEPGMWASDADVLPAEMRADYVGD